MIISRNDVPIYEAAEGGSVAKYPRADPPRVNSQFIESSGSDLHESILARSTKLSKIWRILNNGLDAWPKGTRLVWVEGRKFNNKLYVDLEIQVLIFLMSCFK